MTQKILFIGGTGIISSAVTTMAVERGLDLTLFTRGESAIRPAPEGAKRIYGDITNPADRDKISAAGPFDIVVDWIAFHPDQVTRDIELLRGRVGQYVFISSASAYQKPIQALPITEETPLDNPFWEYSRNKQACEETLLRAHQEEGFPVTIVRPSHTYDKTLLPLRGGYTMLGRMLAGQPVIVPGDGTSLWTLTHHRDFARGFLGLLGREEAVGEAYHITSDEVLSWNQIYAYIAEAAGVELKPVHIPSTIIHKHDPDWGDGLLGDKAHSVLFDNRKIKALVPDFEAVIPYREGCKETVSWYLADPARQQIDEVFSSQMDEMIERTRDW